MNIAELKELRKEVKQYVDHADERMVRIMYAMLEADTDKDWYDEMPDEIKAGLVESIAHADRGQVITHDQMKQKYPQWFTNYPTPNK